MNFKEDINQLVMAVFPKTKEITPAILAYHDTARKKYVFWCKQHKRAFTAPKYRRLTHLEHNGMPKMCCNEDCEHLTKDEFGVSCCGDIHMVTCDNDLTRAEMDAILETRKKK